MRIIVQKSKESYVTVDDKTIGHINSGLVLLVAFKVGDDGSDIPKMAKKVVNLRIFEDESGIMNNSLLDVGGDILSISQFTLYGNAKKGNRPSYIDSMKADDARKMYELFNEELRKYVKVEMGQFQTNMIVHIINDGPTTIILDSE